VLKGYIFLLGARYGLSRRHSQLVSFISRLSTAGLVIGVALLILVMSIMNGFDRDLRENILGIMPQASIYHREAIADPDELIASIKQDSRILGASPFVQIHGLLSLRKQVAPIALFGVDPVQERTTSSLERYLPPDAFAQLAQVSDGILVGRGVADKLQAEVGDNLSLIIPAAGNEQQAPRVKVVRIVAIINSHTELDNGLALMGLFQAAELSAHPGKVTGIRLKVEDLFEAPQIVYDLADQLPMGYYGSSWMRTHGNIYQAIQMSKNLVGMLVLLIVAIAAFNLVSTLIMVVVDKQGDIAILRTMGASTAEIMGIFMIQGGLIGVIGTSIGLVTGALLSLVVTPVVQWIEHLFGIQFLHSDVYPISYLPSDFQWGDALYVVAIALVISFFATLYPAWRAARVQPADALRYE
jgi:lipoprotein-releasing system permease protein